MSNPTAVIIVFGVIASAVIHVCVSIWGEVVTEVYIPAGMMLLCGAGIVFVVVEAFRQVIFGGKS